MTMPYDEKLSFLLLGKDTNTAGPEGNFVICGHKGRRMQSDRLFVICLTALKEQFDILVSTLVCFLAQELYEKIDTALISVQKCIIVLREGLFLGRDSRKFLVKAEK